ALRRALGHGCPVPTGVLLECYEDHVPRALGERSSVTGTSLDLREASFEKPVAKFGVAEQAGEENGASNLSMSDEGPRPVRTTRQWVDLSLVNHEIAVDFDHHRGQPVGQQTVLVIQLEQE